VNICGVPACQREVHITDLGLCRTHYRRWRKHGTTDGPRPDAWHRFDTKVRRDGPTPGHAPKLGPCWEWQAARNRGYGVFRDESGRQVGAHRYAYGREHGLSLHAFTELDHLCRNRRCVRPSHLEPVTPRENTQRAVAARETCNNGLHPAPAPDSNGRRLCADCRRATERRYRQTQAVEQEAAAACHAGHPWTPENTYRQPVSGSRRCRECHRTRNREAKRALRQSVG